MAEDYVHVIVAIISGAVVIPYFGIAVGLALAAGNLIPDLDEYANKKWGSSWITHSAVFPSILALGYQLHPGFFAFGNLVPAFTIGILMHVFLDFIYYEERKKTEAHPLSSLFGKIPDAAAMGIACLPHMPFLFFGIL